MFDIGFSELLLVALVALVVLGPEKLPHAARLAGAMIGKLRRSFFELKWQVEQEIETHEYKKRAEEQLNKAEQSLTAELMPDEILQNHTQPEYSDHINTDQIAHDIGSTPHSTIVEHEQSPKQH